MMTTSSLELAMASTSGARRTPVRRPTGGVLAIEEVVEPAAETTTAPTGGDAEARGRVAEVARRRPEVAVEVCLVVFALLLAGDRPLIFCFRSGQDRRTLGQRLASAKAARAGLAELLLQAEGLWSQLGSDLASAEDAEAQASRSTEEVAKLAADAEQRERELKEAAARDVKAVEDAAMRERAKLRQDLADLRSRLEEEQRQRSTFEQEARLLRTDKEKLKKEISDNQLELSSKCSSLTVYFLSLLELRIRSRDCGE
jgi:hypothetical protein